MRKLKSFKNLGSIVTPNNILTKINEKLDLRNCCLRIMNKIMTARYITKTIKVKIFLKNYKTNSNLWQQGL